MASKSDESPTKISAARNIETSGTHVSGHGQAGVSKRETALEEQVAEHGMQLLLDALVSNTTAVLACGTARDGLSIASAAAKADTDVVSAPGEPNNITLQHETRRVCRMGVGKPHEAKLIHSARTCDASAAELDFADHQAGIEWRKQVDVRLD